ncbi:pyridoxamine 5'-phosphate oxidase family protein [Halorubrum vacuolatum]|uniref:Nitroimidazol reductase NimA, pyridoxamine 5'-phosphate oxidase superfamily n=1 Tax=Halorubrum vacuolatum TaxID=63740 RepID=A0A238UQP6_HALVU|nr:pyridoxamine 5'-phosphate oxidase [Halorubrum vacuolatum]SNR24271.1 Nitroimidazol reductase NimA, pyridoxamine 5'-phosphate oxidase superfamily [Halorubrum vacuolatum]
MKVTGPWDRHRIDEFLEGARIPVRIGCRTPAGDPWIVSLWFAWDGTIHCATGANADLIGFLSHDDHVSFEISTNDPPYRGVRGRGTATVEPDIEKTQLRALFDRYLGGTDSDLGRRLLRPEREEIHIRIEPERLHTWDFTGRMPSSPTQ